MRQKNDESVYKDQNLMAESTKAKFSLKMPGVRTEHKY